jgi:hypothetical protein
MMKLRDRLIVKPATGFSLSSTQGGEGRGEEGRVYWIPSLSDPLPTPASWREGIDRAAAHLPQSPNSPNLPL